MYSNPVRPERPGSPLTGEETEAHRRSKRWSGHLPTLATTLHSQPHCFQLVVLLLKINVLFFTSPHLGCTILSLTRPRPLPTHTSCIISATPSMSWYINIMFSFSLSLLSHLDFGVSRLCGASSLLPYWYIVPFGEQPERSLSQMPACLPSAFFCVFHMQCSTEHSKAKARWQTTRRFDSITDSMGMNSSKLGEIMKDGKAWHAAVHGVTKGQTQLSDWTTMCQRINSKPWFQESISGRPRVNEIHKWMHENELWMRTWKSGWCYSGQAWRKQIGSWFVWHREALKGPGVTVFFGSTMS